ncbi:response regulator [Sphingomonas yunnanensis]|uniref:response regulator n=1 Tax=Sphingomonas yunnanensis TaxID=310400 RepID=UPI001CA6E6DA|nr:response regulator [Sphingomonas yunnanensis]MBY9062789.1 response regulator [Sphingomonas yunnanensis]
MEFSRRILLVEDETFIRMFLTCAFRDAGFTVIGSETGANALTELETKNFAALVTDIRLGVGPSGWDVAHFARQRRPHMAVIYMTGDSAADWISEGVPTSILMQKPFAMARLVTAVANLLKGDDQLST